MLSFIKLRQPLSLYRISYTLNQLCVSAGSRLTVAVTAPLRLSDDCDIKKQLDVKAHTFVFCSNSTVMQLGRVGSLLQETLQHVCHFQACTLTLAVLLLELLSLIQHYHTHTHIQSVPHVKDVSFTTNREKN